MRSIRAYLIVLMALPLWLSAAERMVTEVISIGYRDAGEVAAMLKPLVPPPGTVTSISNQLIVKTTPENLREIRQLLQSIDKAPANLLVSVKQVADEEVRRDLSEASLQIRKGDVDISAGDVTAGGRGLSASGGDGDASGNVRLLRERSATGSNVAQQIRVLEGQSAFIAVGQSRPFREQTTIVQGGRVVVQDSVSYADADSGFYVRPRLSGDRVTLEISPRQNRFAGNRIETREVQTTVSGRLNRWIAIGGSSQSGSRSSREIGRSSERSDSSSHTVYVKVTKISD